MKLVILLTSSILYGSGLLPQAFALVTTTRVSVATDGSQSNGNSTRAILSADGRYVVYFSDASNLVPGDTNSAKDIFARDLVHSVTTRVSVSNDGSQANGSSGTYRPSVSSDGRYIAFDSAASNLVKDDTNATTDIFVRDTVAGTTTCMSVATDGTKSNGGSDYVCISPNGRYVAFSSNASNLVPGDTNGVADVFVHDILSATTERVSVSSTGTQGNGASGALGIAISANGRYIAFESNASNLVPNDTNGTDDIFVRDTLTGTTSRASVATSGIQSNGSIGARDLAISQDGRFVVFFSDATNLVANDSNGTKDVFLRDTNLGTTTRISVAGAGTEANGYNGNYGLSLSADGRYVTFPSLATNLVVGDTNAISDAFLRDTVSKTTSRLSVGENGVQGNDYGGTPSISADGRWVAFDSLATNLVPGDTNAAWDIYVRGPLVSVPYSMTEAAQCARFAAGLANPSAADVARLNVDRTNAAIIIADAVCIARKVAGLEANP